MPQIVLLNEKCHSGQGSFHQWPYVVDILVILVLWESRPGLGSLGKWVLRGGTQGTARLVGQRKRVVCQPMLSASLYNASRKCHGPWNPCNCFVSGLHINLLIACPKPWDIYVELFWGGKKKKGRKKGRKEETCWQSSDLHFISI